MFDLFDSWHELVTIAIILAGWALSWALITLCHLMQPSGRRWSYNSTTKGLHLNSRRWQKQSCALQFNLAGLLIILLAFTRRITKLLLLKAASFQSLKIFRFKHTRQVSKATAAASSSKSHGLAGRGAKLCSAKLDDFACLASVLLLFGQAVKSGPSPEASLAREMKKTNVAFIVWKTKFIFYTVFYWEKTKPKVLKILSSNFRDCKGRVHVVLVSKLLSHPNSLRLGENSVHSLSHESHKRRSDGFEQMQKKSRKVSPNCDSISPVHRRNLGVCSWLTSWVPNMMSRLLLRFGVRWALFAFHIQAQNRSQHVAPLNEELLRKQSEDSVNGEKHWREKVISSVGSQ